MEDGTAVSVAGKGLLRSYQTSVARYAATLDALRHHMFFDAAVPWPVMSRDTCLQTRRRWSVGTALPVLLGEGSLGNGYKNERCHKASSPNKDKDTVSTAGREKTMADDAAMDTRKAEDLSQGGLVELEQIACSLEAET